MTIDQLITLTQARKREQEAKFAAQGPRSQRLGRIDHLYRRLSARLDAAKAEQDLGAIVRCRQAMRRIEALPPFYRRRALP